MRLPTGPCRTTIFARCLRPLAGPRLPAISEANGAQHRASQGSISNSDASRSCVPPLLTSMHHSGPAASRRPPRPVALFFVLSAFRLPTMPASPAAPNLPLCRTLPSLIHSRLPRTAAGKRNLTASLSQTASMRGSRTHLLLQSESPKASSHCTDHATWENAERVADCPDLWWANRQASLRRARLFHIQYSVFSIQQSAVSILNSPFASPAPGPPARRRLTYSS